MSERLAGLLVWAIIALIAWAIYQGNEADKDNVRSDLLTGKIICHSDGLDADLQPKFKCKSKKDIDEMLDFLVRYQNEQKQRSR